MTLVQYTESDQAHSRRLILISPNSYYVLLNSTADKNRPTNKTFLLDVNNLNRFY